MILDDRPVLSGTGSSYTTASFTWIKTHLLRTPLSHDQGVLLTHMLDSGPFCLKTSTIPYEISCALY